jgi:hypothetical protein
MFSCIFLVYISSVKLLAAIRFNYPGYSVMVLQLNALQNLLQMGHKAIDVESEILLIFQELSLDIKNCP